MAARSDLQTRIIISAQDRGASMLLRKLGTEADAATDKFAGMRDAFVSALGGISQGLIIKKAIGWIDDYENTVLSMATTLTDTMRNSGKDLQKVFDQNSRHAESFFKLLQRQANRSYASFDNLKDAYMMFTNVGMALSPTDTSARGLGNLVDRIRMATAGQAENIQIIQEMRSLLSGNVRAGSQMSIMFQQRDPEFARRIKGLVAGGSGQAVLDYLNSLLADFDMSGAVSKMFGKARSAIMTEVQIASIEAFKPFKDELAITMREAADSMAGENSPVRQALGSYADSLTKLLRLTKSFVREIGNNPIVKSFLVNAAPRILAIGSAASTAALAFGALRMAAISAMGTLKTIPGMLVGGYAAMDVVGSWASGQMSTEEAREKRLKNLNEETEIQLLKSQIADVVTAMQALFAGLSMGVGKFIIAISESIPSVLASIGAAATEFSLRMKLIWKEMEYALADFLLKVQRIKEDAASYYDIVDKNLTALTMGATDSVRNMAGNVIRFGPKNINKTLDWLGFPSMFSRKSERRGWVKEWNDMAHHYAPWFEVDRNETSTKEAQAALRREADKIAERASREYPSMGDTGKEEREIIKAEIRKAELITDRLAEQMGKTVQSRFDFDISSLQKYTTAVFSDLMDAREREKKDSERRIAQIEAITSHQSKTDLNQNYQKLAAMSSKTVGESLAEMRKLNELLDRLSSKDKGLASYEQNRRMLTGAMDTGGMSMYSRGLALEYQSLTRSMKELNEEYRRHDLNGENRLMQETAVRINKVNERLVSVSEEFSAQLKKDIEGMRERAMAQNELALIEKQAKDAKAREEKDKADAEAARQRQYQDFLDSMRSEGRYGSFMAGAYDYNRENARSESEQWESVGREVAQSVETSLSDGLYGFFKEGKLDLVSMIQSVNDSLMRSMTDMIARSITDMIVNMVVSTATSQTMLTTSAASASASLMGLSMSAVNASIALASMSAADTGSSLLKGISSGISLSAGLPGFATGGVVTSPTLAMIGEGGMSEAVVPMPDGRSIPVRMQGGGGVTVNIIDNSGTGTQKSVEEERDDQGNTILNVIIDAAARNTRGFRNKLNGALQR